MIYVHSRQTSAEKLEKKYPGALAIDVTSRAPEPWVRLSPFFPHGGFRIPGCTGEGASVEGIWQGLKVFESEGVDAARWRIVNMKGLKRTVRRFGACKGHRFGEGLLGYRESRYQIFLPLYRQLLEERSAGEVAKLRALSQDRDLVLRDYMTNCDVDDLSKPLSHAGLIKHWLDGTWPVSRSETGHEEREPAE